ncbi:MAG: hypothetical protein DLM55_03565 [Acidimicrobiales bacterium]|nr:MAG: hypothetical protein DLM55_03565 [Acidimicrobiales bacterium]
MSSKTTGRTTGKFLLALSPLLAIGSVVLAVVAAQVSYGVARQRESTCNGQIPMSTSAFVLGWAAVAAALLATVVLLAGQWWRDPIHRSSMLYTTGCTLLAVSGVIAVLVGLATGTLLLAGVGAIALVGVSVTVVIAYARHHRSSSTSETKRPRTTSFLFTVLLTVALIFLLFNGFALSTVYDDAPTRLHVCSG